MVLAKSSETDHPDRDEIESASDLLCRALMVLKSRQLSAELEDGDRVLYALQRTGLRTR